MKRKEKTSNELVKSAKPRILSVVASQLKGKNLFPRKVEEAKRRLIIPGL